MLSQLLRLPLACLALVLFAGHGENAQNSPLPSEAALPPSSGPAIADLVQQLGHDDYRMREEATAALMSRGAEIVEPLKDALAMSDDPEVQVRLRFVIDNVVPPAQAVIVLRSVPDAGLQVGDLITHLDGRRVRHAGDVFARLTQTDSGAMLRVRRNVTPLEVGPVFSRQLPHNTLTSYEPGGGDALRRALLLYTDGFAERAYDELKIALAPPGTTPISSELRAILAYTAGDGETAKSLLSVEMLSPPNNERLHWTNPSGLDLSGPLRAPLYFEELLLPQWNELKNSGEPDLVMQRVHIPANRPIAAAMTAATLWWNDYRQLLHHDGPRDRLAGNLLAIVAWMFHKIELQSECIGLIAPRSGILGSKWIRVQADCWPEFLAGDATGAVNRFCPDAMSVLQNPVNPTNVAALTRNAGVAASVAFFLYQTPDDPRLRELITLAQRPEFTAHDSLLRWSLFAITPHNASIVQRDLLSLVDEMPTDVASEAGWAIALLAYADPVYDALLFAGSRERVLQDADAQRRTPRLALLDALQALREARWDAATGALARADGAVGAGVLAQTAEFLKLGPKDFGLSPEDVLLAAPLGKHSGSDSKPAYCVLTRDRRVLSVAKGRTPTTLEAGSSNWYPGPACWPWLGTDLRSGRAWLYDRRRVIELGRERGQALKVNIKSEEIAAFDRVVTPVFDLFTDAVLAQPRTSGEDGEFLRSALKANGDFVSDPDLPEIGTIESIEGAAGLLHLAVRGGPQLLIDTTSRRAWSTAWLAEKLSLPRPPGIFPQIGWGDGPRVLFLFSDQGLIEFLPETESLRRIALPGDTPHPFVIPESCPYPRRDPRWLYIARLPDDGGKVYRMDRTSGEIAPTELVNIVQPAAFYSIQTRGQLRRDIDAKMSVLGIPNAAAFIQDATDRVFNPPQGPGGQP